MLDSSSANTITSEFSNDPDMRELVEMFVSEIPNKVKAFETYTAQQNWSKLRQISHQLKGSAGGYGFDCVTPFARDIERVVESETPDVDALQVKVQQLIEILQRLDV